MKPIESFAQGLTTGSDIRWETYLEKMMIEYVESSSVLRNYCYVYNLPLSTYNVKIARDYPTGMAEEIAEGAPIPVIMPASDTFILDTVQIGTGAEMTDASIQVDWNGQLGEKQIVEAGKRMLRKENYDIANIMLANAGNTTTASAIGSDLGLSGTTTNVLKYEDLVYASTQLKKQFYHPDTAFINPDQEMDLQIDERFVMYSQSGSDQTLREGTIGRVAGLNVVTIPEIPTGTALIADLSVDPIWLVQRQDLEIESYRDTPRKSSGFVVTRWEAPAVVKPNALYKITGC